MLFEHRFAPHITDGTVTVTFRRWRRRQAVAGHRYRTPGGIIEVERIDEIDPEKISARGARRSGYPSAGAVRDERAELAANDALSPRGQAYRNATASPSPRVR